MASNVRPDQWQLSFSSLTFRTFVCADELAAGSGQILSALDWQPLTSRIRLACWSIGVQAPPSKQASVGRGNLIRADEHADMSSSRTGQRR